MLELMLRPTLKLKLIVSLPPPRCRPETAFMDDGCWMLTLVALSSLKFKMRRARNYVVVAAIAVAELLMKARRCRLPLRVTDAVFDVN